MNALVKDKMYFIQMCAVRGALRLELAGMKRSRSPSAYVIAKRDFGVKGSRQKCLDQLTAMIEEEHINQEEKYSNVHPIK
ncbi:MAG: hypothetical protein GQ553_04645 [Nitrosomonadaceae bacterium]|jgi:hypothetical protein|nr:hypothetical protein [Nitrosomonadaceae bacterium]